jgi:hypothetical protein
MTERIKSRETTDVSEKYFKYVAPALIALGMYRIVLFYRSFGISIVTYLDLSEVITSFFDRLIFIVLVFTVLATWQFVLGMRYPGQDRISDILNSRGFWRIINAYCRALVPFFIMYLLVLVVVIFVPASDESNRGALIWLISFMMSIFIIYIVIGLELERLFYHESIPGVWRKKIKFFLSFVGAIALLSYLTILDVNNIKVSKKTLGTVIIFNDGRIHRSDSTSYYIGKTRNYVFIHHQILKNTQSFPMSAISSITSAPRRK